jgi:uncharacterized membrane protein
VAAISLALHRHAQCDAGAQVEYSSIMGLAILVLGLVLFLANHLFVTRREVRAAAIARLGKPVYFALFGIVSLAALALIVWGYAIYRAHEWIDVWQPPAFMRHIALVLMLFAAIIATATFVPSHIKARLKFPMLTAVKTWALAHLLSNGDLGSVLMFGAFLAWAVIARISLKRRPDVVLPVAPAGYTNDAIVVLVGIVVYLAIGYAFHPVVIGVPVFGSM